MRKQQEKKGTDADSEECLVLRSGAREAAFNMALDEALLQNASRLGKPLLRFYGWSQPAASFGYFQKYADVERMTLLRPLVRRPTAGGLVPHDADWTYSLVFPTQNPWFSLTAVESYRRVHLWIQAAFSSLGIATELAVCRKKAQPGECFAGYETSDVLWHGRKIAGAAQRRNRDGLLIQGSVQPPPITLVRGDWEEAMLRAATSLATPHSWRVGSWSEFSLDPVLIRQAKQLAEHKYLQPAFNLKR